MLHPQLKLKQGDFRALDHRLTHIVGLNCKQSIVVEHTKPWRKLTSKPKSHRFPVEKHRLNSKTLNPGHSASWMLKFFPLKRICVRLWRERLSVREWRNNWRPLNIACLPDVCQRAAEAAIRRPQYALLRQGGCFTAEESFVDLTGLFRKVFSLKP